MADHVAFCSRSHSTTILEMDFAGTDILQSTTCQSAPAGFISTWVSKCQSRTKKCNFNKAPRITKSHRRGSRRPPAVSRPLPIGSTVYFCYASLVDKSCRAPPQPEGTHVYARWVYLSCSSANFENSWGKKSLDAIAFSRIFGIETTNRF
jgi:hypothetical protein